MQQLKALFLISLLSASALGATPTPAQVEQAASCFRQIMDCALDGIRYVNAAKALFDFGGNVPVYGSTTTIAVPQSLIDETINKYQGKKQACVTAFNTCP